MGIVVVATLAASGLTLSRTACVDFIAAWRRSATSRVVDELFHRQVAIIVAAGQTVSSRIGFWEVDARRRPWRSPEVGEIVRARRPPRSRSRDPSQGIFPAWL